MLDEDKIRLMKTIYGVLTDRFDTVPKATMAKLAVFYEEETLNAILRDAMNSKNIGEFYNKLSSY